jgi:hypothetical protein
MEKDSGKSPLTKVPHPISLKESNNPYRRIYNNLTPKNI